MTDRGKGRTFPCPKCGAGLEFHIGSQTLKCPFCGAGEAVVHAPDAAVEERDYRAMLVRLRDHHDSGSHQYDAMREVRCRSCGGTVLFAGTTTGTECPYCATPLQLDAAVQAKNRIALDGVLPFQVSEKKAAANLKEWVASRWFAPNDFRKRGVKGKFNGVYLPYWTFDSLTYTRYSGQRGEHYWVTVGTGDKKRRVRKTRWYPASGAFERFFDDTLVVASGGVNRKLSEDLEPWPLPKVNPYDQRLLAGFLVRTYDVELAEGFEIADARMRTQLEHDVRRRIGGDEQRITSMHVNHEAVTFKHLLLPVWMLAYRYRDEPHQVLVNAVTGRVTGERPYSWIKITLAVLAGLLAAGLIWFFSQGGGVRLG
ncbi:hypothetical protein LzC2_42270 [Planctomycetes bacterium LzC2]|uniref:Primosomal protein N' (Replication factor Y)-superfamily II helicase n=1 Tax=Alienimonas chondri TaxID=2681879 RepID=A0ABX1VLG4_9PLAN|nr:hypothetical protein [Alienimonas chondri]